MFTHMLAGCILFKYWAIYFGWPIDETGFRISFLCIGMFVGSFADYLSVTIYNEFVKIDDKWIGLHRNNFSHSIFLPFIALLIVWPLYGTEWALLFFVTMLTHPLIDLVGIGWGVKLFSPFDDTNYKLFFRDKIVYLFNDIELKKMIIDEGLSDWFIRLIKFQKPFTASSVSEYVSIFLIIACFFY